MGFFLSSEFGVILGRYLTMYLIKLGHYLAIYWVNNIILLDMWYIIN